MAKIWASYTHTVHYMVDTEDETIEEVELPGWLNSYQSPDLLWDNLTVQSVGEDHPEYEKVISILENSPLPEELS